MSAKGPLVTAQLFVDLDSARRFKRPPWDVSKESLISFKARVAFVVELFGELQMKVAEVLARLRASDRITIVHSRLYHGWHRGATPTDDRRIWAEAALNFRAYTAAKISFLPDISFGNELLCGGPRTPILDTLRNIDGNDRQKLVDTALVADLLSYTRSESTGFRPGVPPPSLGIVIADDDDILPGLFVAERWGLPVQMLRVSRPQENKHLNVKGMIARL